MGLGIVEEEVKEGLERGVGSGGVGVEGQDTVGEVGVVGLIRHLLVTHVLV